MTEKNYKFQKLTPTKNVELKIYDDALNFVFNNDEINNVAISGPYSAGKSSTIETYKSIHPNMKWLHISLAHFESAELSAGNSTENNITALEGKILNQLIHQIGPDKIPGTNFKVKQKVSIWETILTTIQITSFLILIAYMGFFNSWRDFVWKLRVEQLLNLLFWTTNSACLLLSGALCVAIFGMTLYSLLKTQKNKNIFRKVNFQGNEIEIFEENDDSYFDKYLNEVLYLFENSHANAIVFEDMDRYNNNQIFEKLREINTLLNYRRNKEKQKSIRFFYLLRDDTFVSKDRTKFFDFIIPIVPIIDSSNSYDQFIEHFKMGGLLDLFKGNFLQEISLYVDDMRILKNIYNEFIIYHNQIQSTELDCKKLLAIIAYKNIFPRDFSDLQLGMGFVHTLFDSKPNFVKQSIQNIDDIIRNLEADIKTANDEMLKDIDELDAVFIKLGKYNQLIVEGKLENEYENHAVFIKAIKNNPAGVQQRIINPGYIQNQNINLTSEFEQLIQNADYKKRKEAIEGHANGTIEKIKAEIQKLQIEKLLIESSRLREIITRENIDKIFSVKYTNEIGEENKFEEIKASPYFPLIKYLIRNGHIDETYPDYMTYFYEHSLSRIDKIFLRSITDQVKKDFSYNLKDPQLILSRLRLVDFDSVEILNFALLRYLLKTKLTNEIYLNRFLQQLKGTKNYKFIGEFLATQNETDLFVETINHIWPEIFQCILNESDFSDAQKRNYAIDTLYYSPEVDIVILNANDCLSNFISESPTFLNLDAPNIDKLIDGFSLIEVKFAWIDYSVSNKEFLLAVYEANLYQLNFGLISLILEVIYELTPSSDFNTKSYTLVKSKPEEPLFLYIIENIDEYVNIILENCGESITDDEPAVLEILNDPMVTRDNKKGYINYLQTVIEHIDKVEFKELWSLLLQEKQVTYTENNILNYFFSSENGLDSFLVQFINNFKYKLNFDSSQIDSNFGQNSTSKFFNFIVSCNDLSNERYKALLIGFGGRYFKSFSKAGIADDKIRILIKLNIILMDNTVLIFMREQYPNQLMQFIIHNIDEYTENTINKDNFVLNEMLSILEENVNDEYMVKLLRFTTEKISLQHKNYPDTVKIHILNYNLEENDIPFILSCYPKENDEVKWVIRSISIKYIEEIVAKRYSIPFDLLFELFTSEEIDSEIKKELFVIGLPNFNKMQVKECLLELNMDDFLGLFNRKRPKFEVNGTNEQILTIFKEKQWITRFYVDKEEANYYRAIGRNAGKIFI